MINKVLLEKKTGKVVLETERERERQRNKERKRRHTERKRRNTDRQKEGKDSLNGYILKKKLQLSTIPFHFS